MQVTFVPLVTGTREGHITGGEKWLNLQLAVQRLVQKCCVRRYDIVAAFCLVDMYTDSIEVLIGVLEPLAGDAYKGEDSVGEVRGLNILMGLLYVSICLSLSSCISKCI